MCESADVDLRVGGAYRLANRLPDGRVVWISGEFEMVEPPNRLVYSWHVDGATVRERVTVSFEPKDDETEITVLHERISDARTREQHAVGWEDVSTGWSSTHRSERSPSRFGPSPGLCEVEAAHRLGSAPEVMMRPNSRLSRLAIPAVLAVAAFGQAASYDVKMEYDQRVPMRDGVTLSADVYRPDAPGPFPVILVRTPYDNASALDS